MPWKSAEDLASNGKKDMRAWQEGQMTHSVVICDLMMSFKVRMLVGDL